MIVFGVEILVKVEGYTIDVTFIFVAALAPILFCLKFIALIKIKGHIDILQGISKLDHLMKVSVFQIYKDERIQQQKELIGDSLDRLSSFLSDISTSSVHSSVRFQRDLNS